MHGGHWTLDRVIFTFVGKNFGRTAAEPAMSCQLLQLQGSQGPPPLGLTPIIVYLAENGGFLYCKNLHTSGIPAVPQERVHGDCRGVGVVDGHRLPNNQG